MGHSLLEGAVSLDVDDVVCLVALEVCTKMFDALFLVGPREHVSRAASVALRVRHAEAVLSLPCGWIKPARRVMYFNHSYLRHDLGQ